MKTFSIITTLLLIANLTIAQSAAMTVAYVPMNNEITTSKKADHGQIAVEQFSIDIEDNIQIPSWAEAYGFSGEMIVELSLNSYGAIQKSTIVKSSNSKSIDRAVVNAMSSLNNIDIGSMVYQGATKIRIPLNFKIER